ncbi:hypothetical protein THIOM_005710 [Candidatus Thiomargarita nelsonii]|uniref:Uncharacterized protein n=1 Tax=Candidatus Thiomargarita nelsonii TaxID=1003181 RepID=A0A176RSJ0_9GAMM|nr:hypothetical protein THIOM_005710 [Candidatus Thiomargarita nelsonii]
MPIVSYYAMCNFFSTLRVEAGIPTRSVGTRKAVLVPTLCVGMPARTLRVLVGLL